MTPLYITQPVIGVLFGVAMIVGALALFAQVLALPRRKMILVVAAAVGWVAFIVWLKSLPSPKS